MSVVWDCACISFFFLWYVSRCPVYYFILAFYQSLKFCNVKILTKCDHMLHIWYSAVSCMLLLICPLYRPDHLQSCLKTRRINRKRKKKKRRISLSQVHLMWSWWPSPRHLFYLVKCNYTYFYIKHSWNCSFWEPVSVILEAGLDLGQSCETGQGAWLCS